jgi:hypothetical protein
MAASRHALLQRLSSTRAGHHLSDGACEWPDARTFLDDWSHTPTMTYQEFEAEGLLLVGAEGARAELSLRYIHEQSSDYDREVTVAAIPTTEGLLWIVVDFTRHPDTGEMGADPAPLRALLPLEAATRHPIEPFLLGHG